MYIAQIKDGLRFALPHKPEGSEGEPKCIFITLDVYQATFISRTLQELETKKCDGRTDTGKDGLT